MALVIITTFKYI